MAPIARVCRVQQVVMHTLADYYILRHTQVFRFANEHPRRGLGGLLLENQHETCVQVFRKPLPEDTGLTSWTSTVLRATTPPRLPLADLAVPEQVNESDWIIGMDCVHVGQMFPFHVCRIVVHALTAWIVWHMFGGPGNYGLLSW